MTAFDWDQKASSREQILFAAALLVVLVLFFRVFYPSRAVKVREAENQVRSLGFEKEALTKFSAATPPLKRGEILSQKKGIKIKVLYGEVKEAYRDVTSLMAQMTEPGFLGPLVIQKINYQPAVAGAGYYRTEFSLDVLGGFTDVMGYLERLEQFPALFSLEGVSLQSAEGQVGEMIAEIQGRFFQLSGNAVPTNVVPANAVPAVASQGGKTP